MVSTKLAAKDKNDIRDIGTLYAIKICKLNSLYQQVSETLKKLKELDSQTFFTLFDSQKNSVDKFTLVLTDKTNESDVKAL